jgi:3-methyl-2-oxobutanoate hydroxymethyltransferase
MAGYLEGQEMMENKPANVVIKPGPGASPAVNSPVVRKATTLSSLNAMRIAGERATMLTAYDASFATLMERCGVEMLLIGDSLGMVCQGHHSTLLVSVADIAYHTAAVARGATSAMVLADLPFGSYATPEDAYRNAVILMQAGAHVIKIEGGAWLADTVRFLHARAVPVCAHIGLMPQSVRQMGGYKVQGKTAEGAERLRNDALILQAAGAAMVVLEAIPAQLGKEITALLAIPTIGIGAGPDCSGQVLVMHDMLGVFPGKKARFVKNFMEGSSSVADALTAYVTEVKSGVFPGAEHCF